MQSETDGGVGWYLCCCTVDRFHPLDPDAARSLLKHEVEHRAALRKRVVLRMQPTPTSHNDVATLR